MSTSPVSPEDIRAAAETHQELGPEYSDAVVASFLEKVDREVAARVEARLSGMAAAEPAKRGKRGRALMKRRVVRDALAASAGALALAGAIGLHGAVGPHGGPPPAFPRPPQVTVVRPDGDALHFFRGDAGARGIRLLPHIVIPNPGRH
jgi:hypothetical protein